MMIDAGMINFLIIVFILIGYT